MKPENERRSPSWPPKWAALADAFGGPALFARELGRHYQTVWRWALRGARVPPLEAKLVRVLAATKGLPSPV